jgi:hypothetical protein
MIRPMSPSEIYLKNLVEEGEVTRQKYVNNSVTSRRLK